VETWVLILRLIHILSGVFWAGTSFFMVSFVSPAVEATGPEGQKFMRQLAMKSTFATVMAATATATALSGIILYIILTELDQAIMSNRYFEILGLGAVAGLAGWVVGFVMQNRAISRMKAVAAEIEAAGGPPTPEQMAEMQAMAERVALGGRIGAVLLTIAVVCMAAAQPLASLMA
jgi:uncharacterized membrane protein